MNVDIDVNSNEVGVDGKKTENQNQNVSDEKQPAVGHQTTEKTINSGKNIISNKKSAQPKQSWIELESSQNLIEVQEDDIEDDVSDDITTKPKESSGNNTTNNWRQVGGSEKPNKNSPSSHNKSKPHSKKTSPKTKIDLHGSDGSQTIQVKGDSGNKTSGSKNSKKSGSRSPHNNNNPEKNNNNNNSKKNSSNKNQEQRNAEEWEFIEQAVRENMVFLIS